VSIEFTGGVLVFVTALCYSAVGHAGASGYLAVMAILGMAPAMMRPTALVLNLLVATIGTAQFARAGYFRWRLFWPFAVTSVPAAYVGGRLSLPGDWYQHVVGVVLLLSAARFVMTLRSPDVTRRIISIPVALTVGLFLGLLAGLTGVGGGIFLSPLLLLAGWATLRVTAATSVAFILVNSAAGLFGQLHSLATIPRFAPLWAIAVVIGGFIGSRLGARHLPGPALRAVLALVLLAAGAKLLLV
jgi:uncharacterized membrane protein YfcA